MAWKGITVRGTLRGVLWAAATLLMLLAIGSLLLVRGVVPEGAMAWLACLCAAVSCFAGGRAAMGREGKLLSALAVSGCVYGGMWLATLGGDAPVAFGRQGLILTACVWGGGLLAGVMGHRSAPRKAPVRRRAVGGKRGKRAVT